MNMINTSNTMQNAHIKVIEASFLLETTVIVCSKCGQYLSKPKTEI